jgi:uncharacterized protein (TIGR02001 family)
MRSRDCGIRILAMMDTQPENEMESSRLARSARRLRIRRSCGALIACLWLVGEPVRAGAADGTWNGSIGATTDYVYRGVSQTHDSGALQLGANYQSSQGWFAGTWGSNVDPYPFGASAIEVDLYAGIRRPLGENFNATLTYTRYQYLDDPRREHYDYDEFAVSASYLDILVATLSYQPDSTLYSDLGFARRRASLAYELGARWPTSRGFALVAGGGYYDLSRLFGVKYWAADAGVQYVYRRLTLELTRYFADPAVSRLYEEASADGAWVFSAVYRF